MFTNSELMQMLVDKIEEMEKRLYNLEKFVINSNTNRRNFIGGTECQ